MSAPDFKEGPRQVATYDGWNRIVLAKAGPCRSCGGKGEEFHHLVNRSQGGDDHQDNLVPLCRLCHRQFTDHLEGWQVVGAAIRESLTFVEDQYVIRKKGLAWLDEHYGLLSEGDHGSPGTHVWPGLGCQLAAPSESSLLCARCRRPLKPPAETKPRPRKQKTISVPADEQENGLDVLDTLLEACGEELLRVRGGDRRSTYYEIVDVLQFFLTTPKEAA